MGLASAPIYFPSLILAPIARKLPEFRVRSDWRKNAKRFSALSRYPTLTLNERQHVMDRDPQTGLGTPPEHTRNTVDAIYRSDSRHVLATLIRLLGDFDIAEEALHDAFRAALEQWPREGVPANPRAWLASTGRFKAIDGMRRRARFDALDDVGDKADIAV